MHLQVRIYATSYKWYLFTFKNISLYESNYKTFNNINIKLSYHVRKWKIIFWIVHNTLHHHPLLVSYFFLSNPCKYKIGIKTTNSRHAMLIFPFPLPLYHTCLLVSIKV